MRRGGKGLGARLSWGDEIKQDMEWKDVARGPISTYQDIGGIVLGGI